MRLLENIPESWQKEDGRKGPISVCRPDQQGSCALPVGVSIGEFLSYKTNQKGTWLFDVGQGFPPGWRAFSWRHGRWVDLGFGIPQDFVEKPDETFVNGPEQPYVAHGDKAMIKDARNAVEILQARSNRDHYNAPTGDECAAKINVVINRLEHLTR